MYSGSSREVYLQTHCHILQKDLYRLELKNRELDERYFQLRKEHEALWVAWTALNHYHSQMGQLTLQKSKDLQHLYEPRSQLKTQAEPNKQGDTNEDFGRKKAESRHLAQNVPSDQQSYGISRNGSYERKRKADDAQWYDQEGLDSVSLP